MPFRLLYIVSDILFPLFYYIIRYRRKIVRKNFTESFPDKNRKEIVAVEKKFYRFFIDMALESCKTLDMSADELMKRMKFTNIDLPNGFLAEGRSVGIFLGHFGNWEWISTMSLWLDKRAIAAQIYRKLRNRYMNEIMMKMRQRTGSVCVEMRHTARFMAEGASDGTPRIIGFIADQSPKRKDAKYFVDFLNHHVPVLTGTEKAIKHFGYEALFLSVRRVRRGYYECEFSVLHDNPKALPDFELTDLYFKRLEEEIRKAPELYLWTHNRFKYAEK